MQPTVIKSHRVNEIDLLRFIAALAVVIFHYTFRGYAADGMSTMPYPELAPYSKYGYLGVNLFFMISGFVILMTAASGNLRSFVVSRVVRLYPGFWACCTITFLLTLAIGAPRYSATFNQYWVNMSMLSGFLNVPDMDAVYWSLFVEIRFYALVAFILLIGKIERAQTLLLVWLVASIVLQFLRIGMLRSLLIVDFSAYFIAGALYFIVWEKGLSRSRAAIITAAWGLALYQSLHDVVPRLQQYYATSMNSMITAIVISTFFVVFLCIALGQTRIIANKRWLVVGGLTYPLYLLHQNIGFMIFNFAYPAINRHLLLWGTLIFMLCSAYAINTLVEKRSAVPLRNSLNRIISANDGRLRAD